MSNAFTPGTKLVYPTHGVVELQSIKIQELGGTQIEFYMLLLLEVERANSTNQNVLMVPVKNVAAVGLRPLVTLEEIEEIFEMMTGREVPRDNQTWNRRSREYEEKINTGSLYEIAELVRDLRVLGSRKELSFGEKRVLSKAKKRMVKEIAVVKALTDDGASAEVDAVFADIPLRVPPT